MSSDCIREKLTVIMECVYGIKIYIFRCITTDIKYPLSMNIINYIYMYVCTLFFKMNRSMKRYVFFKTYLFISFLHTCMFPACCL